MSKLEVDKIDPQSGTNLELGTSGDTVTIPTGVTLDASNATTTLPANVVTTDGTQTLTNKTIDASQLSGTITPSDGTVTNAKVNASAAIEYSKLNLTGNIALADLSATGTKDATTFLRGDNTFAEAGGGKILQVVQGTLTTTASRASTSFGDTGLSVSITPSATSSKILIMCTMLAGYDQNNQDRPRFKLLRDSTEIMGSDASSPGSRQTVVASVPRQDDGGGENMINVNFQFLDSPSTTSATTYKTQYSTRGGNTAYINRMGNDTDDANQCRGISVIQAIEVGA